MKENRMQDTKIKDRRAFLRKVSATSILAISTTGTSFSMATEIKTKQQYDFDQVLNRVGVNSIKWDGAIAKYGHEKIKVPMTIADMDFKQMPEVKEAFMKRIQYESYGYETVADSYYNAIIKWNRDQYGLEIKKEWIKNSSGLTAALSPAMRALNPACGKVIIMTPTYSGFIKEIKSAGMQVVMSPMTKKENRWVFDLTDLESRIDSDTKCLILCNPNNPTGECWSADELRALGDVCLRHDVTVLSDEIWAGSMRKGKKFTPYATIGKKYAENSITYQSAAKLFNQPMLKTSYFFVENEKLLDAVMEKGGHHDEVNVFGIIATEVAFTKGHQWAKQMNDYVDENFEYMDDYINKQGKLPGISFIKPEGIYLAWLNCQGLIKTIITQNNLSSEQGPEALISEWLIDNAGVQINPGRAYGDGSEGYLRMNIALPRSHLKLALDNLNAALKRLS